ncbi:SDR family NAD(P)-dependent oxidoreductase [Streptomyces sp. NBC_00264]|uniref:SDR family NAD(P)-dependent oxidoreductase n=1 Tax=Streptomyces TaxID=1883 RepID=UPI000F5BB414|nr:MULTISPECIES: SDR family NAD(P)-dependent oxidoreductase [Streptomyces]WSG54904.1 SDR family NAD(P)-dependent oxidoreductase [Streptomyces sp. NBC_01732]WSX05620.1 SDR family NAD(P)-dependent oxidoreductase [Streptomyces sp. NBC_00987]MCT2543157.1 SDR family NAD(P)-dependent oxidoreductase [Streptomyces atratus]MCX5164693.1 SDR family NAD(P)-dependent oxidoreductase [Streptomyces sp. NBC_00305]MCX5223217.1 SDR family NAD(P)-dependent oxidoreductase [Streptomyces sp. NBC_00264]
MTVTEDSPELAPGTEEFGPGIDPERLAVCLSVLDELDSIEVDHPDAILVRRATAGIYRTVKQRRRQERRAAKTAHDKAVTEATATGSADRIDDETQGVLPSSSARAEIAGVLQRPRSCYICKTRYVEVDAFYHQLCQQCAKENRSRRDARTDLTGRRALLTGGRAKIGMYIALRLLRDGAHTTITTRFPNDAIRRFKAMPDSDEWIHRLKIVGIDLRDPAQVVALADSVAAEGPLDILINNAAQTVRRSPNAYSELVNAESAPLPAGELPAAEVIGTFGSGTVDRVAALPAARKEGLSAQDVTELALVTGSASLERIAAGTAIDAGGLVPDLHDTNSWIQTVEEVEPIELLEVQLCNSTAPFILISRLRPAMAATAAKRAYVVNVSAMEGVFSRGYKGAGHPHTNMAKAALNMLTRTSAQEMFEKDGILMTAVDTGWITDERPHPDKIRLAEEGFHAPLDLVDGAARVYDPIVRGEEGEDLYGCFLKDYAPANW